MRLLVIGINYAPESSGNAPYTTGFAEHMASRGHEVHVLTGLPHYPSWERQPGDQLEDLGMRNGVHVYRRWHYIPRRQSALQRALYEATFLGSGSFLLRLPRPDAIVAIIPALSDGMLARLASRRFRAPYGLVFQDLMGRAARQSGMAGGGSVEKAVRASEGWVARGASRVAIVSDGFSDYVTSLGVAPERLQRVRNWTQIPAVASDRAEFRARMQLPLDAFICLHAGNMGLKQGLDNVVEAAWLAQATRPEVCFVLAGNGNQRRLLEQRAGALALDNLRFLPSLSNQDYADALAAADLLLLNQSAAVKDMAFPSKLSSYVGSGTPILAAVARDSDVAHELFRAQAALMVEPGRPQALLDGIALLATDPDLREGFSLRARVYGEQSFSRSGALMELESFVEHLYRTPATMVADSMEAA